MRDTLGGVGVVLLTFLAITAPTLLLASLMLLLKSCCQ